MTDEWEGTWGDESRWREAIDAGVATEPDRRFTLSRRSMLILFGAFLVALGGLVATSRDGDDGPAYAFNVLADDGVTPLGFDPCVRIGIVVNPRTGPPNAVALVERAVERVAEVSGLDLVVRGSEDVAPKIGRDRPARPRRGAVLVAWSDPDEVPDLAGGTLGVAQVSHWTREDMRRFAYGNIALDGPHLASISEPRVVGVIMHELAHLLGLDHVDDPGELMYPHAVNSDFGPGDRIGLRTLAALPCAGGRQRTTP